MPVTAFTCPTSLPRPGIIPLPPPLDKNCMRRALLALSGLMAVLAAAALVRWALGEAAILPWPVLMVVLAMSGGGFVILMLREELEESLVPLPATPHRTYKRHKPRGKARKRVIRNAFKRRRARKAGAVVLSHETDITHPGAEQVGFFG